MAAVWDAILGFTLVPRGPFGGPSWGPSGARRLRPVALRGVGGGPAFADQRRSKLGVAGSGVTDSVG